VLCAHSVKNEQKKMKALMPFMPSSIPPSANVPLRTTPQFQGRFVTPEKSEWVKRYPQTGFQVYEEWDRFCKAHQNEMASLPDSFRLEYDLMPLKDAHPSSRNWNSTKHDQLQCHFITDQNELVQWNTAIPRLKTVERYHVKEMASAVETSDDVSKVSYQDSFEASWKFLMNAFKTLTRTQNPLEVKLPDNMGNLLWVSPKIVMDRKSAGAVYLDPNSSYQHIFSNEDGDYHLKRYQLYRILSVKLNAQLAELPSGFWLQCENGELLKTAIPNSTDMDRLYYRDDFYLCRQINPGGPVQHWKIDSIDPGFKGYKSLEQLSNDMTDAFSKVVEKAVTFSKKLTLDKMLPGEKDC
jgi:hypothetical protein